MAELVTAELGDTEGSAAAEGTGEAVADTEAAEGTQTPADNEA